MKASLILPALCLFILTAGTAYGQPQTKLIGTWHDEANTTLTFASISPTGELTGTLVGTSGRSFPVIGWVNPAAVASKEALVLPILFSVQLGPMGGIATWAGYLSKGTDGKYAITTIWNITRADGDLDSLNHRTTNNAVFTPGPPPGSKGACPVHSAAVGNEML